MEQVPCHPCIAMVREHAARGVAGLARAGVLSAVRLSVGREPRLCLQSPGRFSNIAAKIGVSQPHQGWDGLCDSQPQVQRMPIYEYCCESCGRLTSQLVLKPAEATSPACRACGSGHTRRVLSGFAYHRSEASRLAAFDPSASNHPDFYKDARNVGLWAKKRAQDMGVDLGPSFDETVEKARTGKVLDEA